MSRLSSFSDFDAILKYEPGTGALIWKTGSRAGLPMSGASPGYLTVNYCDHSYRAHRVAWLLHYGAWPVDELDHINGNRSDNRICNLRDVTHSQNQMNQKCHRAQKSSIPANPEVSRSEQVLSLLTGQNQRDGTRARIRGTGQCPVPFPCPVVPVPCPVLSPGQEQKARLKANPRFASWVAGLP